MPYPHFQPDSCLKRLVGRNFGAPPACSLRGSHAVLFAVCGIPFITVGAELRALQMQRISDPSRHSPHPTRRLGGGKGKHQDSFLILVN